MVTGIVIVVIILGIAVYGNPQRKYERQIALAERYLDELNYEQAISAFLVAIEIDPKNPEAYKALADIYIDMGDLTSAEDILKKGMKETESSTLEQQLAKVEAEISKSVVVEAVTDNNSEMELASGDDDVDNNFPENKTDNVEKIDEVRDGSIRRDGDYILFGYYEQDGNADNGQEPIE